MAKERRSIAEKVFVYCRSKGAKRIMMRTIRCLCSGWFVVFGIMTKSAYAAMESLGGGLLKETLQQYETVSYGDFKATSTREVYDIPVNFGTLIFIQESGSGAVFWFQDDQGNLRNVNIPDVSKPLVIHRQGTASMIP